MATIPAPTDPLPRGWHRVTWTTHGKPRHMITTCVTSAIDVYTALTPRP